MGKIVGCTLVFGDADAEPRLGVTALESGGFEVDPRTQRLKKLPAVLLKGLRKAGIVRPPARSLCRMMVRTPGGSVGATRRRQLRRLAQLRRRLPLGQSRRRRLTSYASRRHT